MPTPLNLDQDYVVVIDASLNKLGKVPAKQFIGALGGATAAQGQKADTATQPATLAQSLAGTVNTTAITPLRLTQTLKANGWLPAKSFGLNAIGESGGTSDQSGKFRTALQEVAGGGGGHISIPGGKRYKVNQDLTVPEHTGLLAENARHGNLENADIRAMSAGLELERDNTILMQSGSALVGLVVMPQDVRQHNAPTTRARANGWTGLAIQLAANHSDQFISNCAILGYDRAITRDLSNTVGISRARIENSIIDCKNGVRVAYDYDVPRIEGVRCYPLLSYGTTNVADFLRSGTAFYSGAINDWGWFKDCFDYGHKIAFDLHGSGHFSVVNCGADYVPELGHDGSIGVRVRGGARSSQIAGFKSAARQFGILVDNPGTHTTVHITSPRLWAFSDGIHVVAGDTYVTDLHCHDGRSTGGVSSRACVLSNEGETLHVKGGKIDGVAVAFEGVNTNARLIHEGVEIGANVSIPVNNQFLPVLTAADGMIIPRHSGKVFAVATPNTAARTIGNMYGFEHMQNELVVLINKGRGNVQFNNSPLLLLDEPAVILPPNGTITLMGNGQGWVMISKNKRV